MAAIGQNDLLFSWHHFKICADLKHIGIISAFFHSENSTCANKATNLSKNPRLLGRQPKLPNFQGSLKVCLTLRPNTTGEARGGTVTWFSDQ